MEHVKNALQEIGQNQENGKVLDVGIGRGEFLSVLTECFNKETQFTGIDIVDNYHEKVYEYFKDVHLNLLVMDGEEMTFENDVFDVACLSNTLHHLPNPKKVLEEMKRVVKPGGYLVVNEMFSDNQSEKQAVHVWIHHLNADIDTARGGYHAHTYKKSDIKQLMTSSGLTVFSETEYKIEDEIPLEEMKTILESIFNAMEKRIGDIQENDLREALLQNLSQGSAKAYETGFANATEYLFISKVD